MYKIGNHFGRSERNAETFNQVAGCDRKKRVLNARRESTVVKINEIEDSENSDFAVDQNSPLVAADLCPSDPLAPLLGAK